MLTRTRIIGFISLGVCGAVACSLTTDLNGLSGGTRPGHVGMDAEPGHDGEVTDAPSDTMGIEPDSSSDAPTDSFFDASPPPKDSGSEADAAAPLAYVAQVLADNPLAYYRLDETTPTTAKDYTGNGNNGTYKGSLVLGLPGAIVGDPDLAAGLPGVNGYVDLGSKFAFMTHYTFSIEAWVKLTALDTAFRGVVSHEDMPDSGRQGYVLYVEVDSGIGFERYQDNQSTPLKAPGAVTTSGWYHVVGTYNGTNMILYVNGAVVAGPTASSLSIVNDTCAFVIGATFCGTQGYFDGVVDEVAIYGTALSGARVLAHYMVGLGQAP